jgi:predicted RNase H-like HicB family nuclease
MRLAAVVQPNRHQSLLKRFSAYCPDLPGCVAHAPTAEEALAALRERAAHQVNSREKQGLEPIKNQSQVYVLDI